MTAFPTTGTHHKFNTASGIPIELGAMCEGCIVTLAALAIWVAICIMELNSVVTYGTSLLPAA